MRGFNARHFMEKAIEVMRKSIAEPREDGKASPKVGAVLINLNINTPRKSRVGVAYRGELRHGDHAEFTLLERKNRDRKLDDCVLFSTLEPCAPNARKHPKLGCAERIVLARIKEVWVGIEDPDPTVDRKGIKYLQDSGVTVHMFDRDLQEVIREENKEFFAQALERAASAAEEQAPEITLSPLEKTLELSQIEDLSGEALEAYRSIAKIVEDVQSAAFRRRLVQQGLLQKEGDHFVPTGFGLLLFGKEPRTAMRQAGLLGTIHFPNGQEEPKDFNGPQVFVPEQAIDWLRNKLPNLIDRSNSRRVETSQSLFELVREGIVNALVHRDYSIQGAKCQLVVTPDTIDIRSPGRPVDPITLEQMQSFGAPLLSRNPVLHYVFAQMEMAEERGLGLKSMKRHAEEAGLPLPRYTWEDPYLALTLYRSPDSVSRTLNPEVLAKLNTDQRAAWEFLTRKEAVTSHDLMRQLGCDEKKAQRILNKLLEFRLIRRVGKGPATRYEVIRPPLPPRNVTLTLK